MASCCARGQLHPWPVPADQHVELPAPSRQLCRRPRVVDVAHASRATPVRARSARRLPRSCLRNSNLTTFQAPLPAEGAPETALACYGRASHERDVSAGRKTATEPAVKRLCAESNNDAASTQHATRVEMGTSAGLPSTRRSTDRGRSRLRPKIAMQGVRMIVLAQTLPPPVSLRSGPQRDWNTLATNTQKK